MTLTFRTLHIFVHSYIHKLHLYISCCKRRTGTSTEYVDIFRCCTIMPYKIKTFRNQSDMTLMALFLYSKELLFLILEAIVLLKDILSTYRDFA